jgi:WD40 repeat protein/serine/threonine protein kinase
MNSPGPGELIMTRRAHNHDLLFGLLALQRGLIDQRQLVCAFEAWSADSARTLAEVLLEQGALDDSARCLVNAMVQSQFMDWDSQPEDPGASRRPGRATVVPTGEPSLPATITHLGSPRSSGDPFDQDGPKDPVAGLTVFRSAGDRFHVVRTFARGGLGEVFLAIDSELDRQVALKELRAYHAHDPASQTRFLREARITGRLEHPGIVPVYGLGRYTDGRPFYAMRFIEGETLEQAIERFHQPGVPQLEHGKQKLEFRRLLRSLIDTCNAVAYAHSRGVVHRDLKPSNIMLGRFGETLVVDWGVAKSLGDPAAQPAVLLRGSPTPDELSLTRPGSAIGTPQYMSPEQALGDLSRVEPASDVYSLGATLYCLLVGHGPFPTGALAEVLQRVSHGVFPAPRRLRKSIDPALEAICLKAMSLRPEDRYDSPLILAGEIESWLAEVSYRSEQERALSDVKRSLSRLCIERAQNLFSRNMPREGMLWLARTLENTPADSPEIERFVRASLGAWHAAGKLVERTLPHGGGVFAVAFSPDGRRLATASADRAARLWDLAKGTLLSAPIRHDETIQAIAFSPDGQRLATASDGGFLRQWDAVTGAPIGDPIRHDASIIAVSYSPDGSRVATASRSRIACLWECATGQAIGEPARHDARVVAIAFDPSGKQLAAADDDGSVLLRETATGTMLAQTLRHEAPVTCMAFSPDGRRLICGCQSGRTKIWDTRLWTSLVELAQQAPVACVAYSPGGQSIATACDDGTARLWDADSARPIGEPLAHGGPVSCLAFSPDGAIVATGSRDRTVRLWSADTALPIGPALGHPGEIEGLEFSHDGRRLATACADGIARCWRVPAPVAGDVERITCWVHLATELEFDEGDAIRRVDQLVLWELRRRLQDLGGSPVK